MTATQLDLQSHKPTRAELNARIAELEASNTHYIQVARGLTTVAAYAETARQRADRDADLAGQRADAAEALAYKLLRENKKLRAEVAVSRRAVALCSVTRAFVVTPPCRALVPARLNPTLLMNVYVNIGWNRAQADAELATLAALTALEFPPAPF